MKSGSTSVNTQYMQLVSENTDPKAWIEQWMHQYGDDVWNFAFSICKKTAEADDITQDVFIKAFRNFNQFRGDASVKTWLLSITRNTALDYTKSAFWRRVIPVEVVTHADVYASAEAEAMENFAVHRIWDLVLKLPIKQREVLILYAHHQLSMTEISEILNVKVGTVKSRLHHARTAVIKLKEKQENGQF